MGSSAYDERIYLDETNVYEREFLLTEQRFWNIRRVYDEILYSSLIKDYESYIKIASKLVDEITPNNDELSRISTIMYLIRDGIFSYTNSFKDKTPCIDIVKTKTGINILEGMGCCRHFASFINDIMPESISLTCVSEEENPFKTEANHVINKITYNGKIYGFDAFNGVLFDFINEFEMMSIDRVYNETLYYKPYAEILFYKRSFEEIKTFLEEIKKSGKNSISAWDISEIALDVSLNIMLNKKMISDFKNDTRLQMAEIEKQIKEIRNVIKK